MLFLFNSAGRPLYKGNVFNIFFLPEGTTLDFRYRFRGLHLHMAPEMAAQHPKQFAKEEILIVFIDRYAAGEYRFIPIRKGKLQKTSCEDDFCYFTVSMGRFVYASDLEAFNKFMQDHLATRGLPRLTGGDPDNSDDGFYAIRAVELKISMIPLRTDDAAWSTTVDQVAGTRKFDSDPNNPYFLKCQLLSKGKKLRAPRFGRRYKLHKGSSYEIEVTYRYPIQLRDRSKVDRVELVYGGALIAQNNTAIQINGYANKSTKRFMVSRDTEATSTDIGIQGGKPDVTPNCNLEIDISSGLLSSTLIVSTIVLFSVASLLVGINKDDFAAIRSSGCWYQYVLNSWIAVKFLGALLQGIMMWCLFRLLGRKVF